MKIQLANVWSEDKRYRGGGWFASPKMDGVRALYDAAAGILFSRTGKPIAGFDHIAEELRAVCEMYSLSFIDGELYSGEATFETIQGAVATKSGSKADSGIRFHAFACLPGDPRRRNIRTTEMLSILNKISSENLENVVIVPQVRIKNEDVQDKGRQYVAAGYEGIMLRHTVHGYHFGRSDDLLKHKFFRESDFTVIGFFEGKGKHSRRLGGLVCEGEADEKMVRFKVGTGFDDETRGAFWKSKSSLIGRVVEVKYQETTEKSLRFPVFVKLK